MLNLDVQFCSEEEGEWDFVGELGPDMKRTQYVLEVCLKFLLPVSPSDTRPATNRERETCCHWG